MRHLSFIIFSKFEIWYLKFRSMPRNRNLLCCLIFLVAGILLSVFYYSYPVHDFGNYYYGSRFVSEGKNINDIYEPYKFNLDVRELPGMLQEKFLLNYAVVPP